LDFFRGLLRLLGCALLRRLFRPRLVRAPTTWRSAGTARPVLTPAAGVKILDATINSCPIANTSLHYRTCGANVQLDFPERGFILQLLPIGGSAELCFDGTEISLMSGALGRLASGRDGRRTKAPLARILSSTKF
jgi:hypothetical protein